MKYIAYYRVSTQKQGNSGLGLQAQKTAINSFLKGVAPIEEFTDIESGTKKGNNRTALLQAINKAKSIDATLVIAKLDRLARNVRFITTLMESGVEFIACDMPQANKFTIHIFAALAEQEAEMISQRTKLALVETKKRGVKLGSPQNLSLEAIEIGKIRRKENAYFDDNNRKAGALVISLRNEGKSFYEISKQLNQFGFRSRKGGAFQTNQVMRLFERYNANLSTH